MSIIQCCLVTICSLVCALLVALSILFGGYLFKFGRYTYDHGGHIDPVSLVSLSSDMYTFDFEAGLVFTMIWLVGVCVIATLVYAICLTIRVETRKLVKRLCCCCYQKPARKSMSRNVEEV